MFETALEWSHIPLSVRIRRTVTESSRRLLGLVRKYFDEGRPGAGIDADVDGFVADSPLSDAVVAVDPMANGLDIAQPLGVQVEQATRFSQFITDRAHLLPWCGWESADPKH